MTERERDLDILDALVLYCSEIGEAVDHFGPDAEVFRSNSVYRNAVSMCLLQIGELSGRLSEDFRSAHPEIPWRNIRGLRNLLAHNYFSIDADTAWDILRDDVPVLQEFCAAELERSSEE